MPGSPTPVEVFYSYAHEDEGFRSTLENHLSLLRRLGVINAWHDRHIVPGTDWAQAIDEHLERASIILLLVSADFLASDYCYGKEMTRALERHEAHEARVIPILLRPVDCKGAPFAHLQALPTNAKAITSWGNQDEAFADVAAGIRRAVEDLSSLQASAPRAALPPVWNVPYPRNALFIGREALLAQLRLHLQAGQATALSQPQAISGLGGIGKTQIAIEYAYRYHQDYQVVLWARAESQDALTSSYVAIASLLNLPEKEAQEQAITVQAVKTWLQVHSGWLFMLDNADDLALVPTFLPPAMGGHLLLTTRAQAMGRLAHRIEVDVLAAEQGALFLLRRAALLAPDAELSQASSGDRALALHITEALGGLPLALDQAGAYLEETGSSLADYDRLFQQHHATLLAQRRGLVADHPEPVTTTWSLSFAQVEERNGAAADLLCLCAFLSPDAIPEEITTQGAAHLGPQLAPVAADTLLLGQAMEALRAYSLIGRDPATKTLSIHRLVQAVLRDAMDGAERECWAERATRAVSAALPAVEHANWSQWERLLAHAQACAGWIEQEHLILPEAVYLLNQAGFYLQERARYAEAEPLCQRALVILEQQLGPLHLDLTIGLNNLAGLYLGQGKYEQAEPLFQRALAIHEQQSGLLHLDTAISLNNLAGLYLRQDKYTEAEPLYRRALAIHEQQVGSEHLRTATSLSNLAALYRAQGKYAEAEPLVQRALTIREQQLGPTHPDTATSLNNLALLYEDQGKEGQAEPLYRRALSICEQQLGPTHPNTAGSFNNLAGFYRRQGKYTEAEPLYRQALAIYEQQLGEVHPNTQIARKNYASLLHAMGRDGEATSLEAKQTPPSPHAQ